MEPIVIGRLDSEQQEQLDLQPQDVTLYGYTLEREEVSETFRILPVIPAGAQLEVIRHTDLRGNVPLSQVVAFLDECLLEQDRAAFNEFLHRPDVLIEPGAIIALYNAVTEYYAARPTQWRSGSASTGSPPKPTSRAAARSAASRSKKSR